MSKNYVLLTIVSLLLSSTSFAHDGVKHEGKPVEGKVTEIKNGSLLLSTEKGSVTVSLEQNTKYELGMDGDKAKKSDIEVGDFLMVEGTKLSTKEVSASEVMIHKANEGSAKEHSAH